jgi:pyridoxine kinase
MNRNLNGSKKPLPTALAIHDLSCFGKCALTVVLPVLSASGIETVPIPTALLSTHTGGFEGYYFEDLTSQMGKISKHLGELNINVDAIYTGFLGSVAQIEKVSSIIDRFSGDDNKPLVMVDPVMGDDGRLYSTYTKELMLGMRELCKKADIITPNLTEACFLTDTEYRSVIDGGEREAYEYASAMAKKLLGFGVGKVVITGIHYGNMVATYGYDTEGGELMHSSEYVKHPYPGTGDLFASVLLGRLMRNNDFVLAVATAYDFTKRVIEYSAQFDTPIRNGVAFEPFLRELND